MITICSVFFPADFLFYQTGIIKKNLFNSSDDIRRTRERQGEKFLKISYPEMTNQKKA